MPSRSRIAVALSLLLIAGCVQTTDITGGGVHDDRTVTLWLQACHGAHRPQVEEEADEVVVHVRTVRRPRWWPGGGDDCADGVTVTLDQDLGDRRLIDGATGEAVDLNRP